MCSLKDYGFNLEDFLKFNDPRTFPRMRDVLPRLFSPSLGNVTRPSTPDEDILSQSVPSSPRKEPNQCTPDQDVSSQSVPSSPRKESNQCTPDEEVSSQSVPPSFRNVSGLGTSNLSESCSYKSCPALIQTERLDKNLTSSSLQTMCDEGTATKDSWLHSSRKNIHSRDAWDTAAKHSSKPTINSAISWTDEELLSIEASLSGFSTGPQPVAASVMHFVQCCVF